MNTGGKGGVAQKGRKVRERCGSNAGNRAIMQKQTLLQLLPYALYRTQSRIYLSLAAQISVEGYSKTYGGQVKLYVSTYKDAVKLCEKLGLSTDCIKEVHGS